MPTAPARRSRIRADLRALHEGIRFDDVAAHLLVDAVEVDLLRALDAARWLVEYVGARADHTSLVVLALHIIRQTEDEATRARGMELFEAILTQGGWHARRAVEAMDGTRS